jgi:hypothetical protein
LQFERHFSYLIQTQQTSIGRFDLASVPLVPCSGKGAFGVTKKLASKKLAGYSSTVDGYKGAAGSGAGAMDRASKEFLSDTRLSLNENWSIC